jgi:sialidase-1
MKKRKRLYNGIVALLIVLVAATSCRKTEDPEFYDVFIAGREKIKGHNNEPYAQFREQNIIVTNTDKIVCIVQGRNLSAWSDRSGQDLYCKISEDNGETWSDPVLMAGEGEKSICPNASVYDKETGRIITLYSVFQWPYTNPESRHDWKGHKNKQYMIYSDDEGLSWSKPEDITHIAKNDSVTQVFGSGEGIQLDHSIFKGRLIVPGGDMEEPYKRVFAWFSDDHGITWNSSAVVPSEHSRIMPCENSIVELDDGTLLMNERSHQMGNRWESISYDGGETWTVFEPIPDLPSVSCNASIIKTSYRGKRILLYAGPTGPDPYVINPATEYNNYSFKSNERRTNGVVFASMDNGESWTYRKLVVADHFAYSSLAEMPDGSIGLFYESNEHRDIRLVKFTKEWLFEDINN